MPVTKIKATMNIAGAISYSLSEDKATLKAVINLNIEEDFSVQMRRVARLWGKDIENSRQGYHLKVCFDPRDDEKNGGLLTDSLAIKVVAKLVREAFPNHQAVLAVHNDTPNKHVHVIIGAVNPLTGIKINMRMSEYRDLKDLANKIAAEYGLSTLDWREATRKKRAGEVYGDLPVKYTFAEQGMDQRGQGTWKGELRNVIDEATIGCTSLEEFRKRLAGRDVILTRCSDRIISYKFGSHHPVRGDTLGDDYTMAGIMDQLSYYRNWPNPMGVSWEDRLQYRDWGRMAGLRRSEMDAIADEIHRATWSQKQDVWADYKQIKDTFWDDYQKRKARLQEQMDEAQRRRKLVKDAQWALDLRNRKRTLAGIIFAAIVLHQHGNREMVEQEIKRLRSEQEALKNECIGFRTSSNEALQTLRQKGLSLEQYLANVKKMQDLAEGMFEKPKEEMALMWRLEQNARVKAPTLDEYLKSVTEEQSSNDGKEEKENEK